MMADPITVDDGGSIRIREISTVNNNLDPLLDGNANANNTSGTAYQNLRIGHHFKDGSHHQHPAGSGTTKLNPLDVVVITSASGHVVTLTLVTATLLLLM